MSFDIFDPDYPHLTLSDVSLTRRPRALSFDGYTAFDMGAKDVLDPGAGLYARAWRIQVFKDHELGKIDVYLSGAQVEFVDCFENLHYWEPADFLFSHNETDVHNFDLTFDQLGRPFVVWDEPNQYDISQVYCYWYDPISAQMEIRHVTAGRTPVAKIDGREPYRIPTSDIILFYIDDETDLIEYRYQRDRFNTAYPTDIRTTEDKYLEQLAFAPNNRLYLWYTEKVGEIYKLHYAHSAPYPYYHEEHIRVFPDNVLIGLITALFQYATAPDEAGKLYGDDILNSILREAIRVPNPISIGDTFEPDGEGGFDRVPGGGALYGDDIQASILREAIIVLDPISEEATLLGDTINIATLIRRILLASSPDEYGSLLGDDITAGVLMEIN